MNLGRFARNMMMSGAFVAVFGIAYLLDCRHKNHGLAWEAQDRCWFTAGTIMGIGGSAGTGYLIGYNTYNPSLRDPGRTERTDTPIQ